MCGICGVISLSEKKGHFYKNVVRKMTESLTHRGPDSMDVVEIGNACFGHTRLSIIDTSSKGTQPFLKNGTLLSVNGEIYNHKQYRNVLTSKGHNFFSNSDSEVILNGYLSEKENVLHNLEGMFAFSLYDDKNGVSILARDRLGIKPIYYYQTKQEIYFASELNCLVKLDIFKGQIDLESLNYYSRFGFVPEPL